MVDAASLARLEACIRPFSTRLPSPWVVRVFSRGRKAFLERFAAARHFRTFRPIGRERTLWGVRFRSPIMNAAGMFKNGEAYAVVARQGAGAYLAGTTTGRPRVGNSKNGFVQPFAPYPRSGAASNWLGLPNPGHQAVAARLAALERVEACPIGASLAADPDPEIPMAQKRELLIAGLRAYEKAGVDFLELNESCPNTEAGPAGLTELLERLEVVRSEFLERRQRPVPLIVKFSCDTALAQVEDLVGRLLELGFDGINFGNTSTAYVRARPQIAVPERELFDFFVANFGGGLSGRPLKSLSLELATRAQEAIAKLTPAREFHVIRTGGIEGAEDLATSEQAGIALNQWYSGYFESFGRHGHDAYRALLQSPKF